MKSAESIKLQALCSLSVVNVRRTFPTEEGQSCADIVRKNLNIDIRSLRKGEATVAASESAIPKDINSIKHAILEHNVLCQVVSVTNAAQPALRQTLDNHGRVLHLKLTDGESRFSAVEVVEVPALSSKTLPGLKIVVCKGTQIWRGTVGLLPEFVIVCGGDVPDLVRNWKEKQEFLRLKEMSLYSKTGKATQTKGGKKENRPPPFQPFGKGKGKGKKAENTPQNGKKEHKKKVETKPKDQPTPGAQENTAAEPTNAKTNTNPTEAARSGKGRKKRNAKPKKPPTQPSDTQEKDAKDPPNPDLSSSQGKSTEKNPGGGRGGKGKGKSRGRGRGGRGRGRGSGRGRGRGGGRGRGRGRGRSKGGNKDQGGQPKPNSTQSNE